MSLILWFFFVSHKSVQIDWILFMGETRINGGIRVNLLLLFIIIYLPSLITDKVFNNEFQAGLLNYLY